MRCKSDGRLLTDELCKHGHCCGHHLAQPAFPTLTELLLLKAGIYDRVKNLWWTVMAWLSQ